MINKHFKNIESKYVYRILAVNKPLSQQNILLLLYTFLFEALEIVLVIQKTPSSSRLTTPCSTLSQSMWDLWLAERHWNKLLSELFLSLPH
jgi:hypothetical protein